MNPQNQLWNILGRTLRKKDPDILIYNERMSPNMIREIIKRDYTVTPIMLKKLEAIANATKTDPLHVLWKLHRKAYIAGLGGISVERTVNDYILQLTGDKNLCINTSTITAFSENNNLTNWKPESPEKIAFEERDKLTSVARTYPEFTDMTVRETGVTRNTIMGGFERGESVDQITRKVAEDTGLSLERARVIVRTEESSITNNLRLQRYQERDPFNEFLYDWVGADDNRTTDICNSIKTRINREGTGKGVPLKRLQVIVEEESIRGNPPSWKYRSLVPHINCRHSITRVV